MKSLAELQAIKEKMQGKVALREGSSDKRVVVGMAGVLPPAPVPS